jgi:hypothetical protein
VTRAVLLFLALAAAAGAEEPSPQPDTIPREVPPSPPPVAAPPATEVQVVREKIRSPHHPQNRAVGGSSWGVGLLCPNYATTRVGFAEWCTPRIRTAMDFPFGDLHLGLMAGDALRFGGQIGFELGTPYFRLRHGRAALAIRMSVDGMISSIGVDTPGRASDGVLALTNTFGPNLSIALGGRATLELRIAGGWSLAGFFSDAEGFDSPIVAAVGDFWLAFRVLP